MITKQQYYIITLPSAPDPFQSSLIFTVNHHYNLPLHPETKIES